MNANYIPRPTYTNKINPFIDKQIIKVFTGQRRVGKSYIMQQMADVIKAENPQANIIFINCELEEFHHLKQYTDLLEFININLSKQKNNYLFVDEIQEISSFQLALRSILAENKCDIYCTGSNAKILSGELATYLSGRYIEIPIHSLSFTEFLIFHNLSTTFDSLLKYLNYGGMPYLVNIGLVDEIPFEYINSVYTTILLKDVVMRENIRNVSFLENLVHYLADNVGNLFSANNISKFLKSQHITISPQLTINYLSALCNAYFIHKVQRTDVNGLKIFEIGEKYYFEDIGLRNAIIGFNKRKDLHKILENAVYLHLIQLGYHVSVGKAGNNEIDFVAESNGLRVYIQVCLQMTEQQTEQREFGNLIAIADNYPKYVITLNDNIIGKDYKGIKQVNLLEFLLKTEI
ncbi:MAG: ATP-binding protein [Bacteroidota bacterium]